MFSDELDKYSWEETTEQIYSKTSADVEAALGKSHLEPEDFMALISPAASKYLEPMAALSRKYTQQRFGKTISLYIRCTSRCISRIPARTSACTADSTTTIPSNAPS